MKTKKTAAFLVVLATVFAVPGFAEAGNVTRKDGRDARNSALDIASVGHRFAGRSVTHTLRTYGSFSGQLLKKDNAIAFAFDSNEDFKPESVAIVTWLEGRLRAVLVDSRGRPRGLGTVKRPDARTVAVTLSPVALGGERGQYRWLALTTYKGKKTCRRTCTDVAPNGGLILNRLWQLHTLSVALSGNGLVRSAQAPIACPGRCSATLRAGTKVTLNATPADGWAFNGWSGACSGTAECTVTMDAAKFVTATFLPQYSLSVSMAGPGEVILVPPNAMCSGPGPCIHRYLSGATVTLTVSLGMNYLFDGWSGACAGTNPVCTLTMDGNKAVVAHTRVRPTTLNVAIEATPGAGGRVTSSPPGIDCPGDCSETWSGNVIPTLTATPNAGSVFLEWKAGTCQGMGPVCMVSLWPNGSDTRTATASFGPES